MADVEFELNVFGDEPRCHLKLTGPGTPTLEFVVSAFKRLNDAVALWAETEGKEAAETPQDEAEAPPKRKARPRGGLASGSPLKNPDAEASRKQQGLILGLCEALEDEVVVTQFARFGSRFDSRYTEDGAMLPSWDFLNSLTNQEAHDIIDRLKKIEKPSDELPFE